MKEKGIYGLSRDTYPRILIKPECTYINDQRIQPQALLVTDGDDQDTGGARVERPAVSDLAFAEALADHPHHVVAGHPRGLSEL